MGGVQIKQEAGEDDARIVSKEHSKRMFKLKIRPDRLVSQLLFAATVINRTLHLGGSMSPQGVRLAVVRSKSRFSFFSHTYHNCPISAFVNKIERLLNEKAAGDAALAASIAVVVTKEPGVGGQDDEHESPVIEEARPKEEVSHQD